VNLKNFKYILIAGILMVYASSATAFSLSDYQLGLDYSSSHNSVFATYETSAGSVDENGCSTGEEGNRECEITTTTGGSNGIISGWGIFLQPAFKRQGDTYFDWGLDFGARYLAGSYEDPNEDTPLESLGYNLAAILAKPYIKFGVTPAKKWPDVLISIGPMAQVLVGQVEVNDESESAAMAATSSGFLNGFFEIEIVLWRFGEGALSLYSLTESSNSSGGSEFFRGDVDEMEEIKADFSHGTSGGFGGYGLKILTTWP
jgi:hypothetical protein